MALDPTRRPFTSTTAGSVVEVSVLWVQQRLNAALAPSDLPRLVEDGVWGARTQAALVEYVTRVLGAPLDSTRYAAQLPEGTSRRIGMTVELESALAGESGGYGSGMMLLGGAVIVGLLLFAGSQARGGRSAMGSLGRYHRRARRRR